MVVQAGPLLLSTSVDHLQDDLNGDVGVVISSFGCHDSSHGGKVFCKGSLSKTPCKRP